MVDVWVCNSSPLISLARIGRLDLIESLAAKILVPATVVREIEAGGDRDSAAHAIKASTRLQVTPTQELGCASSMTVRPGAARLFYPSPWLEPSALSPWLDSAAP